jgi:hypothetical protein
MPRHKKHITNPYLSYDKAQEYVLEQTPAITTRAQYLRWHKEHNPSFLPRWPHHVWDDFSWNRFLNTSNSFEKTQERILNAAPRVYRNMWEAVRYAQGQSKQFQLSSQKEWELFYDEYDLPNDIPKRPHQAYDDFPGYDVWLGKSVKAHIATAQESVAIVGLHHMKDYPPNCVMLKVWKDGYASMKAQLDDDVMLGKVYRLWDYEEGVMPQAMALMERHGHKRDGGYVIPNPNALLWDLDSLLMIYKP